MIAKTPSAQEPSAAGARDVEDSAVPKAQFRIGETLLGKWHIDSVLGVGGTAAVYAATHHNGSRVAVKMLHADLMRNRFARERFLWEGHVANAVGHEGVIKVLDDDTAEDGSLFMVTELLDGETLDERRVRHGGRMTQEEVLLVVDQILDVLVVAHAKGIVHRDLKPQNVLLTRDGRVKVLDFGIARWAETSTASSFTQTGVLVGTPAYMAPEQARGLSDDVDAQSDLWACGAMMFFLLSGRCVHEGGTLNEQLGQAMQMAAPPLRSVAPALARGVAAVVDKALQLTKQDRWPDAARMRQAVRSAYEALTGHALETAARLGDVELRPSSRFPEGSCDDRKVPETTRPVVSAPHHVPASRGRAVAALRVLAFVAGVTGAVWMVAHGHTRSPPPPSYAATPAPRVTVPEPPPVTTLRVVAPPARPASIEADASRGSPRSAPAPVAVTPGDCRPPFALDPTTHKKRWKLHCL